MLQITLRCISMNQDFKVNKQAKKKGRHRATLNQSLETILFHQE